MLEFPEEKQIISHMMTTDKVILNLPIGSEVIDFTQIPEIIFLEPIGQRETVKRVFEVFLIGQKIKTRDIIKCYGRAGSWFLFEVKDD